MTIIKKLINAIKTFIVQYNCNHVDIRYKSDNPNYKYVEVCNKCGSKKYIKGEIK